MINLIALIYADILQYFRLLLLLGELFLVYTFISLLYQQKENETRRLFWSLQ